MTARTLAALLTAVAACLGLSSPVSAGLPDGGVGPYYAPPFRDDCTVHRFGEGEAPEPGADEDDPYCVEYAKRDITLDNGGAVEFLLAEPDRVAAALPKCAYWQRDHWSVQVSRGETPLVRWDGSYWFDKGTGQAAARMRRLRVLGQPATLREAARAVEPWSPELADFFRGYSKGGDGAGWSGSHPFDPRCAG